MLIAAVALLPTVGCLETGPTTSAQVCEDYRDLAEEMASNSFFDNGVFRKAGSLGRTASRYEGSSAVQAEGERLEEIGDSDRTSDAALDGATRAISSLCGQSSLSSYTLDIKFGRR